MNAGYHQTTGKPASGQESRGVGIKQMFLYLNSCIRLSVLCCRVSSNFHGNVTTNFEVFTDCFAFKRTKSEDNDHCTVRVQVEIPLRPLATTVTFLQRQRIYFIFLLIFAKLYFKFKTSFCLCVFVLLYLLP